MYTFRDRMFMRQARFMAAWYRELYVFYNRLGWQERANAAFDKSMDWYESGWECSQGM
jgi:hypothetical protein